MAEDVVVPENSKKKKNPIMMIIIIILVIILLAAGFVGYAYFTKSFFFAPTDAEAAKEEVELELDETMFALNGFVVNLKTENSSKRYLKVAIALGCINKKDIKKLEQKKYQIRDTVITTFRSKDIDLLSSVAGQDKVKEELVENINSLFHPDIEMNVYYTEYIIQ